MAQGSAHEQHPHTFTGHTELFSTITSFLSFLWRLTPAIPKNLFSLEHQQYDPKTVLNIRWGSEKYTIDFPGKILGHIKLGELREICKDLTGVPLGGLTLSLGGTAMKDDNAPLSCFGVKPDGKVIVDGYKPTVRPFFFQFVANTLIVPRCMCLTYPLRIDSVETIGRRH